MKTVISLDFISKRLIRKWKEGETPMQGIFTKLPNPSKISTAAGTKFFLATDEGIFEINEAISFNMKEHTSDTVLQISLTFPYLGELAD